MIGLLLLLSAHVGIFKIFMLTFKKYKI